LYSYCSFLSLFLLLRPPHSTLFPYTTLFRSRAHCRRINLHQHEIFFARARRSSTAQHNAAPLQSPNLSSHLIREFPLLIAKRVGDRKSTRLNSSHEWISYAVFCLKKKITTYN